MKKILIHASHVVISTTLQQHFDVIIPYDEILFSDGTIHAQLPKYVLNHIDCIYIYHIFGYSNIQEDIVRIYFLLRLLTGYVRQITLLLPYIPYSRKDRSDKSNDYYDREQFVGLIQMRATAGVSRIITCDLHNTSINSCCPVPVLSIDRDVLFESILPSEACVVSPDFGSAKWSFTLAQQYNMDYRVITKMRNSDGSLVSRLYEYQENKELIHAMILDDIIDSGKTLYQSLQQLYMTGCRQYTIFVTHALLSGDGKSMVSRIQQEFSAHIVTTNSYYVADNPISNYIDVCPFIAPYIS